MGSSEYSDVLRVGVTEWAGKPINLIEKKESCGAKFITV